MIVVRDRPNSETVRDRMSVRLLLIANRKSHTGFRLVPTSMPLNDIERRNSPYFAFFPTEFDSVAGLLVEDRPIMSVVSQFRSSTFGKTNAPGSAVSLR